MQYLRSNLLSVKNVWETQGRYRAAKTCGVSLVTLCSALSKLGVDFLTWSNVSVSSSAISAGRAGFIKSNLSKIRYIYEHESPTKSALYTGYKDVCGFKRDEKRIENKSITPK